MYYESRCIGVSIDVLFIEIKLIVCPDFKGGFEQ